MGFYDEKTVINRFLENSEVYLQLEHYLRMYREYGKKLPLEEGRAGALAENEHISTLDF